jgi:hypothetical protein
MRCRAISSLSSRARPEYTEVDGIAFPFDSSADDDAGAMPKRTGRSPTGSSGRTTASPALVQHDRADRNVVVWLVHRVVPRSQPILLHPARSHSRRRRPPQLAEEPSACATRFGGSAVTTAASASVSAGRESRTARTASPNALGTGRAHPLRSRPVRLRGAGRTRTQRSTRRQCRRTWSGCLSRALAS